MSEQVNPRAAQGDGQSCVGRELDAAVAECVMGLSGIESVGGIESIGGNYRYHNATLDAEHGGRWTSPVPCYSTDVAAARLVQDRIGKLGLQNQYVEALVQIVGSSTMWALLSATPEQQCQAALIAKEGTK